MILAEIHKLINRIGDYGTDLSDKNEGFNRLIRTVNFANLIAIFSYIFYTFLYAIIDFHAFLPVIITTISSIPFFALSLYCNKKRIIRWGRFLFQFGITSSLLISTSLFVGRSVGIHYFFLVIAVMPSFIWTIRNRIIPICLFLINAACFVYVEFYLLPTPFMIKAANYPVIIIFSIILCITSTLFIIILNQMLISKHEKTLEEQKKNLSDTNEKLNELNKTKDTLLSIIAHDLKSPFNTLIGFSGMVLDDPDGYKKEEIISIVKKINHTATHTYLLLENLLIWAKSQKGNLKYKPAKIHLNNVVENVFEYFSHTFEKKNILITNLIDPVHEVMADFFMLHTILRNLISNAVKFSFQGGEIRVSSVVKDKWMVVSIKDYGVGISNEKAAGIFSMDNDLSTVGTAGETGTGIGLNLCRELVEKHGGVIKLESAEGKGCRFYFTLPML
jgi:signal transduction histidine kinase